MKKITISGTEYVVDGDYPGGPYTMVLAHGWTQDESGEWIAPSPLVVLKTKYSHRDFILRIGEHYAAIERLKDANAALPPDQKNYELSRLFTLWDKAEDIDLEDADLHSAFGAFVSLGIMAEADANEILTPNEVV